MENESVYELMFVDHERELVFPQGWTAPAKNLRELRAESAKRNAERNEDPPCYVIFMNGTPCPDQ